MAASLTEEQVADYRRDGYLALRGVFSADEVAAWEAESKRLLRLGLSRDNLRAVTYRTPTGLAIVDRIHPVADISPMFKALAGDARILGPLRQLYGGEMLLFKDKIIYKMPGVSGYPLHQDYSWWQAFPLNLANVILSIDPADFDNGGVEFFPGYHDRLLSAPGETRHMNETEAAQIDLSGGEVLQTSPGDVVLFDCLTPHRSGVNRSNRLRRQLYFSYSEAGNGDLYDAHLRYVEDFFDNKKRIGDDENMVGR
ncbi:MAG TPA: phytanoyl-CoA dioxygenase family protein [Pyrinomonadaceae bacterium]|jgi:ectoine hydroxylase-related dioxygenase (phytanoyl-CoA dioxygenase family)|nr:phytanoyl-CoA dioxygenase family protein [Pyrinomonadaceae bacterium]